MENIDLFEEEKKDLQEEKKEKKDWFEDFFIEFWNTYPSTSSKQGINRSGLLWNLKGNKIETYEKLKKHAKSKAKSEEIISALREQIRYARHERDVGIEKPFSFIQAQVWVNKQKWGDEIASHHDLNQMKEAMTCVEENCKSNVLGPKFIKCFYHYSVNDEFKNKVRSTLEKNNVMRIKGESMLDWKKRLRACVNESLSIIGSRTKQL